MNYAVILSGGIGTRMHMGDFPKQYYKVKGKMILEYTLDAFEKSWSVDEIVIVMAPEWQEQFEEELRSKYKKLQGTRLDPAGVDPERAFGVHGAVDARDDGDRVCGGDEDLHDPRGSHEFQDHASRGPAEIQDDRGGVTAASLSWYND